jgi:N-methylhydantoinase A
MCLGAPPAYAYGCPEGEGARRYRRRRPGQEAMEEVAGGLGCTPKEAAERIVDFVVERIVSEIRQIFREWEQEPAYRIWELMKKEKL